MPSTELAVAEPRQAATVPQTTKSQRISKPVRHAASLLARGECRDIKAAAERAGLTREHLSRMLHRPHVQVFLAREARRNLSLAVGRASNRVVELMDAASEHVSLDASKYVLAIEGIKPQSDGAQVTVNVNVQAGYVLDLRDGADTAHSQTIEHKPLTDKGRG